MVPGDRPASSVGEAGAIAGISHQPHAALQSGTSSIQPRTSSAVSTSVSSCGSFAVELNGRRVGQQVPGRQARLLLAYLVLHRPQPIPSDAAGRRSLG